MAGRRPLGVGGRVDDEERYVLAVELERRRSAVEEARGDGDDLAGEVAEGHLVDDAADAQAWSRGGRDDGYVR